jgi:hypothetical protein
MNPNLQSQGSLRPVAPKVVIACQAQAPTASSDRMARTCPIPRPHSRSQRRKARPTPSLDPRFPDLSALLIWRDRLQPFSPDPITTDADAEAVFRRLADTYPLYKLAALLRFPDPRLVRQPYFQAHAWKTRRPCVAFREEWIRHAQPLVSFRIETDSDLKAALREILPQYTARESAERFGMLVNTIREQAKKLGVRCRPANYTEHHLTIHGKTKRLPEWVHGCERCYCSLRYHVFTLKEDPVAALKYVQNLHRTRHFSTEKSHADTV